MISTSEWVERVRADGEFTLAARGWSGGLLIETPRGATGFTMADGNPRPGVPEPADGVIVLTMPDDLWIGMTAAMPRPFHNDVSAAMLLGLRRHSDEILWWQYMPALQRAVELARAVGPDAAPPLVRPTATPTGRYVNLDLVGADYRIYVEEAGCGIPLLLQHTAGSHGVQWRHLFEMPEITDHFRLIAYDLPFHGKSVPPVGPRWWETPYRLEGVFLRTLVTGLSAELELDQPVFMGCSVGGLLALDLAFHHPDLFRAVVALQGALHIGGRLDHFPGFWHPQVSNESKAKMMEGMTAPQSPVEFRKETIQAYASGWPPVFIGDLAYYIEEFDIRSTASLIDTSEVGVHILTGDYDPNATVEKGREAHEAIAGSTFAAMPELGHFPMSENPERFASHLLPVLDRIRAGS
ncbi:MAG: alpha/beta hydrolase [Acidimicrobiaceae bacterium]|nr:alpha/beta hydrolase [Acidimicrobiaceae bacterium]